MPAPDLVLLARARSQPPRAADVAACWAFVIHGLELGWLEAAELAELAAHLDARRDWGTEELLFAHVGDVVRVAFLDDHATCAPEQLVDAIRGLRAPDRLTR